MVELSDGLIDIHSHLLPGIDDGCADVEQSLQCVRRLIEAGFVASVCTPHVWYELFPQNTPANIHRWTAELQRRIDDAGLRYRIYPGGELRLHEKVVRDFETQGLITLADSKCVLVDLWADEWPGWIDAPLRWLQERGYQPILAHPERINRPRDLPRYLEPLRQQGVWLQGNFRCMTGEEGYFADRYVRQFLADGWYQFLALDLHRPDTLEGRLDGVGLVARELGRGVVEALAGEAPRREVLGDVKRAKPQA